MSDYGLLATIKEVLEECEEIRALGMEDAIHYTMPSEPMYPVILLEVDDIKTNCEATNYEALARVDFKINLISEPCNIQKSLQMTKFIEDLIDGVSIRLSQQYLANFRKTGNVVDMPISNNPRSIKQYYQAVVWRRAHEQYC